MLVVVSDTHGREGHRLEGRTLEAVREADLVCHCGDFTTEAVLDAFEDEAAELVGVVGNNDEPAVRDRLPTTRLVEYRGFRIGLAHGHDHGETHLSLFGRQSNADLVCVGHSHRPSFGVAGDVPVLNPGSHADPRFYRPAHAELDPDSRLLASRSSSLARLEASRCSAPRRAVPPLAQAEGSLSRGLLPHDRSEDLLRSSSPRSPSQLAGRLVEPDGTVVEQFQVAM